MIEIEKLKQKILDLAIRGKLVPQNPDDEPASALIERIRAEKETLIKQGKIKRTKDESYIYKGSDNSYYEKIGDNKPVCIDNELPFEIPNSWMWARLSSIIKLRSGDGLKVNDLDNTQPYPVYGGNGINGTFNSFNVEPGTLIIGRVGFYCGSVHKTLSKAWVTDNALIVTKKINSIDTDYLELILISLDLGRISNSTAQPVVSGREIYPLFVPIAPIEEQKRIINIANKARYSSNFINKTKNDIANDINNLKYKILDLFFGENSRYKSYYGKRTVTTLQNLVPKDKIGDGDWVLSKDMNPNGSVGLLQLKHIGNGIFMQKPFCYVDENFFISHGCSEIKDGYLLINRLVASSMKCCLMPKSDIKTITSVDVCWIAPDAKYNTKYLMYYLLSKSFQDKVALYCSGSTRKRISKSNLIKIELLVHDRIIQNKIVNEIETIFTTLEKIVG